MNLKHYDNEGQARFITFCTHRRLPLLTNNVFRKNIIESIVITRNKYEFKLIAYVIMPEHVHLIILPKQGISVSSIIGEIKRVSAKNIHRILIERDSPLISKLTVIRNRAERFAFWQRRCYDHNCRSEKSMWEKVEYCHNNPVKRGLVKTADAWQWSSYRWYQGQRDVLLEMDILPDL